MANVAIWVDPEQDALAAVDVLGHQGDAGRVVLAADTA